MHTKEYNLHDTIRMDKILLTITGFYPHRENPSIMYRLRRFFFYFVTVSMLVSLLGAALMEHKDLSKLAESLLLGSTHISFFCKLSNFLIHRKNVVELEEYLKKPIFYQFTREQIIIYKKKNDALQLVSKIYKGTTMMCVIFYAFVPFLDSSTDKALPFPGIFPWKVEDYFYATYFYQILMVGVSAYNNSTLDCLASTFISLGTSHFSLLRDNLRNIRYGQDERKTEKFLKYNFRLHQETLEYVKLLETTFSNGIFVQFLATIFVLCFTCFQLMLVSDSSEFVMLVNYFFCMTYQVSMYCWYGHEIMAESMELSNSCYMTNWYESSIKIRKFLIIFMERTKKPVKLTAGKFFTLVLATLTGLLRTSYSYFAVLKQVYD